jgi:hypothetical protein
MAEPAKPSIHTVAYFDGPTYLTEVVGKTTATKGLREFDWVMPSGRSVASRFFCLRLCRSSATPPHESHRRPIDANTTSRNAFEMRRLAPRTQIAEPAKMSRFQKFLTRLRANTNAMTHISKACLLGLRNLLSQTARLALFRIVDPGTLGFAVS